MHCLRSHLSAKWMPLPFRLNPSAVFCIRSLVLILGSAYIALGQYCEHQWGGEFAEHDIDGIPFLQAVDSQAAPPLEIRPLIISSPSSNRVDLIFFGDGYTIAEKDKFFDDALFLATNLTDGQTFSDVLPLVNWWAGFSASTESGIGVGGRPKDIVYGLYRDGTELRGVYYQKPEVARAACQSTDACDYPILLGNDPFYGGLGGTCTVTTSSPANGPAVLRHELGHSIIGVGEEYDRGQVYRGVNSARTPEAVPCTHWYSNPSIEPKIQRSNMPIQAYPWTLLNTTQAWSRAFTSAGSYDSYLLQFSVSGVTASTDLRVEVDGKDLGWEVNPVVGLDRWIYNMKFDDNLLPGAHQIKFTLLNQELQGTAQLCNLEVIEYDENDAEFNFEPEFHGIFPTYSSTNATTYRPTNDLCLMRTMHSPDFCQACIEGLWISFLRNLALIDNVTQAADGSGSTNVTLGLLPLAQFREHPRTTESYIISWIAPNGTTLSQWDNKTNALLGNDLAEVDVEIQFSTTQVRVGEAGVLKHRETIQLQ